MMIQFSFSISLYSPVSMLWRMSKIPERWKDKQLFSWRFDLELSGKSSGLV